METTNPHCVREIRAFLVIPATAGRFATIALIGATLLCAGCDGPAPAKRNADRSPDSAANVTGTGGARTSSVTFTPQPSASDVKVRQFPDLPPWKTYARGVESAEVSLSIPANAPGYSGRLILYRPIGQTKKNSLGCVFIAPAGAPIFAGNILAEDDRREHVPYAKAGYAVVAFEIDGKFDHDHRSIAEMRATYSKFKAADGGMVNGKNAVEYALAKMPQVDPERLYVAGHSSAATFALLFAEHVPRLKGCIAYAPLADLLDGSRGPKAEVVRLFPGIAGFSPIENCDLLKCPLFLFQSQGDTNVSIATSRRFVEKLKQTNPSVTFQTVPTGDHYSSMINPGIPMGIKWLKSLPAERKAEPTLPILE
jgi:dienelactone hydrolase